MKKGIIRPKQPRQHGKEELAKPGPKALRIPRPRLSGFSQEIKKLKQTLAEWDTAFDSVADLISIHDRNFHVTRVNRAFADAWAKRPGN